MKRIVIVGATSGIGLQVAVRLALKGHRVGVAGRNTAVLKELKGRWPEKIEMEEIDVTKDDAPRRLKTLIDKLGGMDVYFHAAGVGYENAAVEEDANRRTLEVNAMGFTRMIDAAFRYFRDGGCGGHIAAITSVAGVRGIGPIAAYSATKRYDQTYLEALDQLARAQGLHIRFTDIRPGWVATPLLNPEKEHCMTMTPDYAVPLIIKSLKSCRRVNYVDWRYALVAAAARLVPPCLWVRLKPVVDYAAGSFPTAGESRLR